MKAVLAALETTAESQRERLELLREMNMRMGRASARTRSIEGTLHDTSARLQSIDETMAEIKDLVTRAFYQ